MVVIEKLTETSLIFGASAAVSGRNVLCRLSTFSRMAEFSGGRFVDIGGGRGSYAVELLKHCQHLTLVDLDPEAVDRAKEVLAGAPEVDFIVARAEKTGLPADSYDTAFLIEVLDHVNDPQATVREAFRLLRPGGRLYVAVPNKAFPMETHPVRLGKIFVLPHWVPFLPWIGWLHRRVATARVFTARGLVQMFQGVGFTDIQTEYMMPPFERHPGLRPISDFLGRTPLRRFGVSICATMTKPLV